MDETQDETDTAQAVKATALIPYAEKVQLHACISKRHLLWEVLQQAGANETADHCAHG